MRALKLWIHLRYFGLEGLRRRIERHLAMAQRFAGWVETDPEFELLAPVPFSTVCFRHVPAALAAGRDDPAVADRLDRLNTRLMEAINRTGQAFLSHSRLKGCFAIRVAINNLRTEDADLDLVWQIVRREADALRSAPD